MLRNLFLNNFIEKPFDPRIWDWSKVSYTTSSFGRKFARHPSGMGTVMSFNDGTDRNVLVLDAQYRKLDGYAYYTDWAYSINDHLSADMKLDLCTNIGYAFGSSVSTLPFTGMSDTNINASYSTICNQDTKGSKYNTDSLFSLGTNAQAATYCRNEVLVNSTGCDMPNINTLIRIYTEMIMLDSMDESELDSSDGRYLCNWFDGHGCWSSSWYGATDSGCHARYLGNDGRCYPDFQNSNSFLGILPVLEME